ncbi:MAG: hypothetical protein WCO13_14390 [Bacteroidota bacterium]
MIDYIEISKHLSKDKPNLKNLVQKAIYLDTGVEKYSISGVRPIEIYYDERNSNLKIKGSLPYFVNGQNFYVSNNDYLKGIEYIENILNVNLSEALIDKFEYGKIIEVEDKANLIINNHFAPSGIKTSSYTNGKYFEYQNILLKLYNAKENIFRKLDSNKQKEIEKLGFNRKKEYIKFEVKYKKPHFTLNNGKGILVTDLANTNFKSKIENDFINQYNFLKKRKCVEIPINKKDLSSGNIILLTLEEVALNEGKTAKELIYSTLKQIPNSTLNKDDKKARQRQFRNMLEIIETDSKSKYDLLELFQNKLL